MSKFDEFFTELDNVLLEAAVLVLKDRGSVVLHQDEVSIVNKLLAGYHVGPEAKAVLDKLKGAA